MLFHRVADTFARVADKSANYRDRVMFARRDIYDAITERERERDREKEGGLVGKNSSYSLSKKKNHGTEIWNIYPIYIYIYVYIPQPRCGIPVNDSLTLAVIWPWKLRTLIKRQWAVTRSRYHRRWYLNMIRRFLVRPIAHTNCTPLPLLLPPRNGGERAECYQLRRDHQSAIVAGN